MQKFLSAAARSHLTIQRRLVKPHVPNLHIECGSKVNVSVLCGMSEELGDLFDAALVQIYTPPYLEGNFSRYVQTVSIPPMKHLCNSILLILVSPESC